MRPSLSTFFGYSSGVALIMWAIYSATDDWHVFVSIESLAIVLGGTICAILISANSREFAIAMGDILFAFGDNSLHSKSIKRIAESFVELNSPDTKTKKFMRYSTADSMKGVVTKELYTDPIFMAGIEMVSTAGANKDSVIDVLRTMIDVRWQRRTASANILGRMGKYAPGFGMVGTIIGLIIMLGNMTGDFSAMGRGLQVAFITTFYGIILSQMIFLPSQAAVTSKQESEYLKGQMIIAGFKNLLDKNAGNTQMEDDLNAFNKPQAKKVS